MAWDKLEISNAESDMDLLQNLAAMMGALSGPSEAGKFDFFHRIQRDCDCFGLHLRSGFSEESVIKRLLAVNTAT